MTIEAVTFDYWDTIVAASVGSGSGIRRLQIDRFAATAGEAGQPVGVDELAEAFDANWERFEEAWVANTGQYTPADSVAFVAERVGIELAGDLGDRLVDGFRLVGEAVPLELGPGIEEAIATLRAAGIRLGIVCDVGLTPGVTLRRRLEQLALLDSFDAWAFSDETGWFKPAADAFAPALDGLAIADPSAAAHVGDNRRTDVAGGLALGMTTVRFTGFHDRPDGGPEAHHVIDDHRRLPELLGVA
ncbi:MAG: HAD family hydrolase [Actinomycetota bacterium]